MAEKAWRGVQTLARSPRRYPHARKGILAACLDHHHPRVKRALLTGATESSRASLLPSSLTLCTKTSLQNAEQITEKTGLTKWCFGRANALPLVIQAKAGREPALAPARTSRLQYLCQREDRDMKTLPRAKGYARTAFPAIDRDPPFKGGTAHRLPDSIHRFPAVANGWAHAMLF
jgi:hypothetical protein